MAKVLNSSVQAAGSLSSQIFIAAEWSAVCLDMTYYSRDATDAIGAFLAHRSVHDIRNRCCTRWGPSRDNNSASRHEYFRQLTAVLISEDTSRRAKDPINLILNSGGYCNYFIEGVGGNAERVDKVLACKMWGGVKMHFFDGVGKEIVIWVKNLDNSSKSLVLVLINMHPSLRFLMWWFIIMCAYTYTHYTHDYCYFRPQIFSMPVEMEFQQPHSCNPHPFLSAARTRSLDLSLNPEEKNPSTRSPERLSLQPKTKSMGGQSHTLILGQRTWIWYEQSCRLQSEPRVSVQL